MRRLLLIFLAAALASTPLIANAQMGDRDREREQADQEDAAAKRRADKEWGDSRARLPQLRNAGPCPFVKTLYDAARYVEFKDGREASANVAYTGEIQDISAGCSYKDDEPIKVVVDILFELGRGPQATGAEKTFRYWVAVTDRNRTVIAKKTFDMPVKFEDGRDRAYAIEKLEEVVIPRASMTTSGANFEVLIGFEVTPEMAAFNRDGKRFRLNAGGAAAGTSSANP